MVLWGQISVDKTKLDQIIILENIDKQGEIWTKMVYWGKNKSR